MNIQKARMDVTLEMTETIQNDVVGYHVLVSDNKRLAEPFFVSEEKLVAQEHASGTVTAPGQDRNAVAVALLCLSHGGMVGNIVHGAINNQEKIWTSWGWMDISFEDMQDQINHRLAEESRARFERETSPSPGAGKRPRL